MNTSLLSVNNVTSCLQSTQCIDSLNPAVIAYAKDIAGNGIDHLEQAIRLYYAVRDNFVYDPYRIVLTQQGVCASRVLEIGYGWCVTKSGLLVALCRAIGIPAKLGYADVRNHLSTRRLREVLQTDVYYWHGYAVLYLNGKWVKATPVFDQRLCEKLKLAPLDFDGRSDSIMQACDLQGNRHMEYLLDRGQFIDIPVEEIRASFLMHYPNLIQLIKSSFGADVVTDCGD